MAYPDDFSNLEANKANATPSATDHPAHHNALANAINRIEQVLGLDPAATYATVADRLAALEGSPGPTFGTLLPTRIGESGGDVTNCANLSALTTALGSAANGSILNITSNINNGGSVYNITRNAAAGAPITITSDPGVLLTNFSQINCSGSYIRFLDLDIGSNTIDGLKINGTANHIEVDGCHVHDNVRQGINIQDTPSDIQIWNCIVHDNGDPANNNLDHGIYMAWARGSCVIANCLVYENSAYNMQIYPNCQNLIITACTLDDGVSHAFARGGMVLGSESGVTDNNKIVGLIGTNAAWYAIDIYNPTGNDAGNQAFDCIGFDNDLGDYVTNSSITYSNCIHADPDYTNIGARNYTIQPGSPAIDHVQAEQYGYLPATDINGDPRVTADAGCYAA